MPMANEGVLGSRVRSQGDASPEGWTGQVRGNPMPVARRLSMRGAATPQPPTRPPGHHRRPLLRLRRPRARPRDDPLGAYPTFRDLILSLTSAGAEQAARAWRAAPPAERPRWTHGAGSRWATPAWRETSRGPSGGRRRHVAKSPAEALRRTSRNGRS